MITKIKEIWTKLRASLWFLPMLMFGISLILALGFIRLDAWIDTDWLVEYSPVFAISSDGTRAMLLAVAGSMLTVMTLSFTLTLTSMTYAAGQFTPRILRNFMRDRSNQFVLGYFIGIFAYSLVASLSIRSDEAIRFVPIMTAFAGLLLTLGGVIVLIFFIHHISKSLQISTIIHHIVDDTQGAIDHFFPGDLEVDAETAKVIQAWQSGREHTWRPVPAGEAGYIQFVDTGGLIKFAKKHEVIIRIERTVGQFVPRGAAIVSVTSDANYPAAVMPLDQKEQKAINHEFGLGRQRVIEQDVGFGLRQIVDIALKALSPGVNDTSTGVTCIQYLGDTVGEIARKDFPLNYQTDDGTLRLITCNTSFKSYVETAFDQIRVNGRGNVGVLIHLAEAVGHVGSCTDKPKRHRVLADQLKLIETCAETTLETEHEKQALAPKLRRAREKLTFRPS